MRIVFYISHIGSGGAARVLSILANQFADDGNSTILVTNFKAEREYFLSNKIERFSIESKESQKSFIKKNVHRIRTLRRIVKKCKPDVVISFMLENDSRAYIATRGLNTKLVLSVRNDPASKFSKMPIKQMAKYFYTHSDGVVFQTQQARDWFKNIRGVSNIIYNPVENSFFGTVRSEQPKDIVTTGKFLGQKNHMMLIKAYHIIADRISDNLVIYGDGKLRPIYEKYIKDNGLEDRVFLPGFTTDVSQVLSSARLFVMSSDYEGMPNSLMEAMTVGVPCISTDCPCGGPRELMTGDMAGNLVHCGDYKALAKKMLDVMNNTCSIEVKEKERADEFRAVNVYMQWRKLIEKVVSPRGMGTWRTKN